jgi:hypothetical protein
MHPYLTYHLLKKFEFRIIYSFIHLFNYYLFIKSFRITVDDEVSRLGGHDVPDAVLGFADDPPGVETAHRIQDHDGRVVQHLPQRQVFLFRPFVGVKCEPQE